MRLPDWNDLTNEQREALVKVADYNLGGTDAEFYAGQTAMEIYTKARELVTVEMPPLIAPLHERDATPSPNTPESREERS